MGKKSGTKGTKEPVYSWQSSAADTDFEAKFSLTPLLFGTLKAAFYAMLFAVPLAVMGAIYTANFMDPRMRAWGETERRDHGGIADCDYRVYRRIVVRTDSRVPFDVHTDVHPR